jgi:predicted phosphodiesterase
MSGITWLHISDWHQKETDWDRRLVGNALVDDIKARAAISPDLADIDFIVFSGDIANSGRASEYEQAVEYFFKPLKEATNLGDQFWERLFIVPGNHDMDRLRLDGAPLDVLNCLKTREGVNSCLLDKDKRKWLLDPFSNYSQFIHKYLKVSGGEYTREPEYFHVRSIEKEGKVIAVAGFNSAWMSGRNLDGAGKVTDYGRLILGEPAINTAIRRVKDADIRIAAMHHPITWLTDFDRDMVEELLYRDCHFVLHGHQHLPRVHVISSTIGDTISIPAGTVYSHRFVSNPRYINSYNFVHINFDNFRGKVYLRRWDDKEFKWVEDGGQWGNGRFPFVLPKTVEKRKGDVYNGQVAHLVKQFCRRFCESHVVSLKHSVEIHNNVSLARLDIHQRLSIAAGPQETYPIVIPLWPNERMAKLAETSGLNIRPEESVEIRINGRVIIPEKTEDNKLAYPARLNKDPANIELKYTLYMRVDDFYMLSLDRFTEKFRLSVRQDHRLNYEYLKLGEIPTTRRYNAHNNTEEIESNALCRAEQGYVIQWYTK